MRQNPKLSGTTHNVFGIQVGVGITVAVRNRQARASAGLASAALDASHRHAEPFDEALHRHAERSEASPRKATSSGEMVRSAHHDTAFDDAHRHAERSEASRREATTSGATILYHRVPELWRATEKLIYLGQVKALSGVEWQLLRPDAKQTWLTEGMEADFDSFLPIGTKATKARADVDTAIFKSYSGGVKSNRDEWAYDFDRANLSSKVKRFVDTYNGEADRWQRRADRSANVDHFVLYDDRRIKWSESLKANLLRGSRFHFDIVDIRRSLYRPFCLRYLYFDRSLIERLYQMPISFPVAASERENLAICITDLGSEKPFMVLLTHMVCDLHLVGAGAAAQCFPFYTYAEDGTNRRENITDWALQQFQAQYGAAITKRDIFNYVYAVLHSPQYRERYAENLKRELPRIPFVAPETFQIFVDIGAKLADLHLSYERAKEYPLRWIENKDIPFSWRVTKMKLTPAKDAIVVNESLTLGGIPKECFEYRLGNRSALEWAIDQYQVSTDKRSGIASDPNRADDEEYIVRLVGRVVTVSVETVRLVRALPEVIAPSPVEV